MQNSQDNSVPVTTAWHVVRLRMEERHPIWRVAGNVLNKQSRTDKKGVVLQLGGCARYEQLLTIKNDML